jgi:PAS domain S-box-containing protein
MQTLLDRLVWENKLLWSLSESSFDGIFLTDAEGLIVYFNPAYIQISGFRKEQLINRRIQDLVRTGEIPDACSPEVMQTLKPVTKYIHYHHGVSALVTSTPIFDDSGKMVRIFSNVRDITQLIKLRAQLDEYSRRLRQAELMNRTENKLIVASKVMETIITTAARVANFSSPILLQGESGVGKDMLARYIHDCSDLSPDRPFVQINCGAIPELLLESELFGYEAGAFTGASSKGKIGLMELANQGTLFLDEIGEVPLALQVKLLQVLQTNTFFRVGGTKKITLTTRIIAATNSNLEELLATGRFRQDLYYRLNVVPIRIPPLRERREDIVPLLLHFLEKNNQKFNFSQKLAPRTIELLANYSWPGNVRELANVLENMMIMTDGNVIEEHCIPLHIHQASKKPLFIATPDYFDSYKLADILTEVEKEVILKAIAEFGPLRKVAVHLGVDLSTLVRKKRKYKI